MKQPVIDSLIDLFGQNARIRYDTYVEPTMIDALSTATSFWKWEYTLFVVFLAITAIVIYRSEDVVGRIFKIVFSFPAMVRQLNYVNQSVDVMTERIVSLFVIIFPLTIISHYRVSHPTLFHDGDYTVVYRILYLTLAICIYNKIVKFLFLRISKRTIFYRKLYLAEKICLSAYIVILFPLLLLTLVSSPYQDILNSVQLLLVIVFYAHFLITNLKLFIEEKVSYVQLILYFCTVNVVLSGFIIYFIVYFI